VLPGVSGYEVLRELRRHPDTGDVGVILLTARREEADRIKGLSLGADDYLTKPFSPQELTLRVAAVLRRLASPAVAAGSLLVEGPLLLGPGGPPGALGGGGVPLPPPPDNPLPPLVERPGRAHLRPPLLAAVGV